MSYSADSDCSRSTIRVGRARAIWRQSSEPIEPPAPVTSTVFPSTYARDRVDVDLDRLAAEQVLHLHGPDLAGEVEVALEQLVEPRQRLDRDVRLLGHLDDALAHLARRGRDRDQHLVRVVVAEDPRQLVDRPEHAHAVEPHPPLARVVVDEADRRHASATSAAPAARAARRRRRRPRSPRVRGRPAARAPAARTASARACGSWRRSRAGAAGRAQRSRAARAGRSAARSRRRGRRAATPRRRRARSPTCRAWRRSATSGGRSR